MKTIAQFAEESRQFDDGLFPNWSDANIWDEGVKLGVQFAETWIPVEEELPEVVKPIDGCYNNDDLLLVKWKNHGSMDFAVLIEDFGVKVWDMPDRGIVSIDEISHWRPINRK